MAKRPYLKLRRLVEDRDMELGELAARLGICSNTMTTRFNGSFPWRSDEIAAACRVLQIPQEQIGEYFFPEVAKEVPHAH